MTDPLKLIPADLYAGITGDAEDVFQARIDRETGLVGKLHMEATEAEARGDIVAAAQLDQDAIALRRFFLGRAMKSITLYKAENPYWLTDASFRDNGDLVIMSGDTRNDWSKIVPADSKPALLSALLKCVTIGEAAGDDADDRLLRALSAIYAGDTDAYEKIKVFLENHEIPAEDSNWLWGGSAAWDEDDDEDEVTAGQPHETPDTTGRKSRRTKLVAAKGIVFAISSAWTILVFYERLASPSYCVSFDCSMIGTILLLWAWITPIAILRWLLKKTEAASS